MIITYGFSHAGLSHLRESLPCQDAHKSVLLNNGWAAAAIADGLGSSQFSEKAAAIAVGEFELWEGEVLPLIWESEVAMELIKKRFERALTKINAAALADGVYPYGYNTTLTAVLYDGFHMAYGHSGDGGIIGLTIRGKYKLITEPQKGEEHNSVIPFNSGEKNWVFGYEKEKLCSLMMVTDGLLDVAAPSLLKADESSGGVYINFVRQFMDATILGINAENQKEKQTAVREFFLEGPSPAVTDDKTMVCLISTASSPLPQEDSYFAEPDWDALHEKLNRRLYRGDSNV